jgi:glycogen debranching enzyme
MAGTLTAGRARRILDAHWRPDPGFTVPSAATYPHQWLWDSCFHAVVWAHLGEGDRAVSELTAAFAHRSDDGFVPHLTYWGAPDRHAGLWGRRWASTVTQPPMYGHALAELARLGVALPDELVRSAVDGLRWLLVERDRGDGRLVIMHPWESGCDDSPRWDGWYAAGTTRFDAKGDWVRALDERSTGSSAFEVASAAFAALVVFNVAELATVTPLDPDLTARSAAVAAALERSWDAERCTFVDHAVVGPSTSTRVRVVEALLPALVVPRPEALDGLDDPAAFGGTCGPAQVHRDEPAFDPGTYWRGPAWPPLTYLLGLAATRRDRPALARSLRATLRKGAARSGWAEYWHPDTGAGLGAVPQSWATLAVVPPSGAP